MPSGGLPITERLAEEGAHLQRLRLRRANRPARQRRGGPDRPCIRSSSCRCGPARGYDELIGDDAMLPANSFCRRDEASLDVPGSPRADGLATSYLLPAELGSNSCPVRFTGWPRTESPDCALVRRHRVSLFEVAFVPSSARLALM